MPKKNQDLPGVEGEGISPLCIPELDKAIAKYEKRKDARVAESPGELESKRELKVLLHLNREKLPLNGDGVPFYRCDDRDYVLDEKLVIKTVGDDTDGED